MTDKIVRRAPQDTPHVYFFDWHNDGKYIYIGWSEKPNKRSKAHEREGGSLIACMPGTIRIEKMIQEYFSKFRNVSRGGNSVFSAEPELWEYIVYLLDRGYACKDLKDLEHIPPIPVENADPSKAKLWLSDPENCRQCTLFPISPRELVAKHAGVAYHLSQSNEWFTPIRITDSARIVMGSIDTDPASCPAANRTINAAQYWSERVSGLDPDHSWRGNVWMNPPYGGEAKEFVDRLFDELNNRTVQQAILLLNLNAMSSLWYQPITEKANAFCITRGRLDFEAGTEAQGFTSPATGSVISYFGANAAKFAEEFAKHGHVCVHWDKRKETP